MKNSTNVPTEQPLTLESLVSRNNLDGISILQILEIARSGDDVLMQLEMAFGREFIELVNNANSYQEAIKKTIFKVSILPNKIKDVAMLLYSERDPIEFEALIDKAIALDKEIRDCVLAAVKRRKSAPTGERLPVSLGVDVASEVKKVTESGA